ncbi:23S rRNA (pseudouridine(1915)-N(3))-methyltransferase RlmH [Algihabitans albus]|uniref:23S rRNA (pseudouridine(1915)-N(3))-methyltransferase RlmH n=1 Tax=Algihabitans albus TaxID=2164067 RepID=UPI000E5C9033|nr:23S rRNA (pseudouridine(1915)-N(3))-methyltransferase RlmH [Algihabitans albus]
MRSVLAAVGRLKPGPMRDLYADYAGRLGRGPLGPLELREVEARRPLPSSERMLREAELLRAALPEGAVRVALDERGRSLDSDAFAQHLGGWIEDGRRVVGFWIGGADGLHADLRAEADLLLSFGSMTWPHLLVRILLAEQLYRAGTILTGHPYHRA